MEDERDRGRFEHREDDELEVDRESALEDDDRAREDQADFTASGADLDRAKAEAETTHVHTRDREIAEVDANAVGGGTGAVTGAVIGGLAGGPIGAVIGAAAGALAGIGIAHGVDAMINHDEEDSYWRQNFKSRPYANAGHGYDEYRSAYRYGWESRARNAGQQFDHAEPELQRGWEHARGNSHLTWEEARQAARDAWDRVDRRFSSDREVDRGVSRDVRDDVTDRAADEDVPPGPSPSAGNSAPL
jgi:hypothetical protein